MVWLYRLTIAWGVAIFGGLFAAAGGVLASLNGSPYYLIAGFAMVVSSALLGRHPQFGRLLFVDVWVGTLIWAVWEVGFDDLQLVPRLVAPTVLLAQVLLTGWRARSWRSPARAVSAAAVLLALDVGGIVLHGAGNEVQGAARAAAIRPTTTGGRR